MLLNTNRIIFEYKTVNCLLILQTHEALFNNWNLDYSLLGLFRIAPRLSKQNRPLTVHYMQNTTRVALLL
jgi:hypothetical protein